MATKIEGWANGNPVYPGRHHSFTDLNSGIGVKATLVIGDERVFTESEVRAAAMAEPELPGDMPDEMWDAIQHDKDAATEAMRIIVRQTRDGILRRLFDPA